MYSYLVILKRNIPNPWNPEKILAINSIEPEHRIQNSRDVENRLK